MASSSFTTSLQRWPATATVLTWLKRRRPWWSRAAAASLSTSSVPRRFTLRQAFSDLRFKDAAKNRDPRLQMVMKTGKIKVQLEGAPQAHFGLALILGAYQQIEVVAMPFQQPGRHVRADVAG